MHPEKFRNPELVGRLVSKISELGRMATEPGEQTTIMEVCGTHTMAIGRYGLRSLFPNSIRLLSGPGCPVCVTPQKEIDRSIEIGKRYNAVVTTFGDMFRVPGSVESLEEARADGLDVRIVYSPAEAVATAVSEPDRETVFLGVGFETTAPVIAAALLKAKRDAVRNFTVLPLMKTVPIALETILRTGKAKIDGFLLPGHVCSIIGTEPFEFIPENFGVPCVVAGFEPVDILQGIEMLLEQMVRNRAAVEIAYRRAVTAKGNPTAQRVVEEVFSVCDSVWRAIGTIPGSGLGITHKFEDYDAGKKFPVTIGETEDTRGCMCGEILMGQALPADCPMFGSICTPEKPIGPCMVSSEGTCAAYYKYGTN